MPHPNLNDILTFMAVVDAGTFVGGSRAMGLTRSAAGKAVNRLEERLGARLINRTTRNLSLTDEGRVFYERGSKILEAVDDAEAGLAGRAATPRGLLRLTVPDAFGRLVLFPLIRQYLETWPEVKAEVNFTDRRVDIVEEGFDLAVRIEGSSPIGASDPDSRLVSRVVARYRAILCASPAYVAVRGEPAGVDELRDHDCLVFSSRAQQQSWTYRDDGGSWTKARIRSRLRMDSGEALVMAAVGGLGIAYLPEFLIHQDLASGRLQQILPNLELVTANIVTIYPTRRFLEPRVRHFIELMVDELSSTT